MVSNILGRFIIHYSCIVLFIPHIYAVGLLMTYIRSFLF